MSFARRAARAPTARPPMYPHVNAETGRIVGRTAKLKNRGGGENKLKSGAMTMKPGRSSNSNASSQSFPTRIALTATTAAATHQKAVREKWRCVRHAIQGDNTIVEMRRTRNTRRGFYPNSASNSSVFRIRDSSSVLVLAATAQKMV